MLVQDLMKWVAGDPMLQLTVKAILARDNADEQARRLEALGEYAENLDARRGSDLLVEDRNGDVTIPPYDLLTMMVWCDTGEIDREHCFPVCACRACRLYRLCVEYPDFVFANCLGG